MLGPYIRFNPCDARPLYIRFNPCDARPLQTIFTPNIIFIEIYYTVSRRRSVNHIIQFRLSLLFINRSIFRHLNLEIALAIPGLNEWKIETYNLAAQDLITLQLSSKSQASLSFLSNTAVKIQTPSCCLNKKLMLNAFTRQN